MRHHLGAPFLVDEGEVVAVDGRSERGGFAGGEVAGDERLDFRVVRAEVEHDDLVLGYDATHGLNSLVVDGGGRLRPVEVVQVEDGQDEVVFDEGDLLVVETSDEARRLDVALQLALDGENQLREHAVYVRRMVLGLGPKDTGRTDGSSVRVLNGLAARSTRLFRRHAEVDVADNASAVERTEEVSGDLVLQFLFSDGRWVFHIHLAPFSGVCRINLSRRDALDKA